MIENDMIIYVCGLYIIIGFFYCLLIMVLSVMRDKKNERWNSHLKN